MSPLESAVSEAVDRRQVSNDAGGTAVKPVSQNDHDRNDSELEELLGGLRCSPKQVPCSFLYDEAGSDLYNQITELEEYYPYRVELAMLQEHARDIISHIPCGSVLVELGCGSASKTAVLQRALLARDGPDACTFVGIDVSADFLEQARHNMLEACPGLRGDRVEVVQAPYMEGLKKARQMHPEETLCILWLGSSVGNLEPEETLQFFKDMLAVGGPKTEVLLCTDLWKDEAVLHAAYCDGEGVTEAFIKNGIKNAILAASGGCASMDAQAWEYDVVVNPVKHQVEMYVVAGEEVELGGGITIKNGERILMEISRKFLSEQLRGLAYRSGFYFQAQWCNDKYSIQMLCAPSQAFLLAWRDTDNLFARMHDWGDAPIDLRHPFGFYYGHMCSFAKLRLLPEVEASDMDVMFSRGIDPDVADPSKCHSHPEAPQKWPSKPQILRYVQQQREDISAKLEGVGCDMYLVCMSLEHERMHQETLCYMLAQQQKRTWEEGHLRGDGTVLENGVAFEESLARWGPHAQAGTEGSGREAVLVDVPAGLVTLGTQQDGSCGFVWDNEGPKQPPTSVAGFQAASRPVSIGEFREFVVAKKGYATPKFWEPQDFEVLACKQRCPSHWTLTEEGDVWVHYPEGTRNWREVRHRPVWCSLAEARAYCRSMSMRLMTEEEHALATAFDPCGARIGMLGCGGWEHTSTEFAPLSGFKAMDGYEEYSTDFFDGKHFVLKGFSPYTPPSVARPSFRNFYQDVYPNPFAKFRCCR